MPPYWKQAKVCFWRDGTVRWLRCQGPLRVGNRNCQLADIRTFGRTIERCRRCDLNVRIGSVRSFPFPTLSGPCAVPHEASLSTQLSWGVHPGSKKGRRLTTASMPEPSCARPDGTRWMSTDERVPVMPSSVEPRRDAGLQGQSSRKRAASAKRRKNEKQDLYRSVKVCTDR
jgi:hypothetical protein